MMLGKLHFLRCTTTHLKQDGFLDSIRVYLLNSKMNTRRINRYGRLYSVSVQLSFRPHFSSRNDWWKSNTESSWKRWTIVCYSTLSFRRNGTGLHGSIWNRQGDGLSRFHCSRGIALATLASMNECKWKGCQTCSPRLKQKWRCMASLTDSKKWRIDCAKADATGTCIPCQEQSRRGHEGSKFHWLERGVYEWSEEMLEKVGAALIPIVTWNSNTIPRG